jgi:hypothetical protein
MILFFLFLLQEGLKERETKYYVYLNERGELQIKVHIWGEVNAPGMYSIPEGTDLITLFSLAGGHSKRANLSSVKVIHNIPEERVSIVNLEEFFRKGKRGKIPTLKPGDVVIVEEKKGVKLREKISYMRDVLLVIGAYLNLYLLWKER